MNKEYSIDFAHVQDIDSWMKMIEVVRKEFPGLQTQEQVESYRQTVIKNINRQTAFCVKHLSEVVGVLIFSYNAKCLSCLAVHPDHRRKGIASEMISRMIELFPNDVDISVTTYREGDTKGIAPRPLYKKFGFIQDELTEMFNYPHQKLILRRKKS